MKNSKSFSTEAWLEDTFLSATQLEVCRALFLDQTTHLELVVIDLPRLDAELRHQDQLLACAYLDSAEQGRLASFGFAKRRLEWLGGRIAAKKAAIPLLSNRHYSLGSLDLRIEADPQGRPYLRCPAAKGASLPGLSISHSGSYAGGLAVRGQGCGLDLQKITPRVIKVRGYFATDAELATISASQPGLSEAAVLSLIWSAKEAFRKAIASQPLVGFNELTLLGVVGDVPSGMIGYFSCPRLTSAQLPAFLTIRDDFACAITVS